MSVRLGFVCGGNTGGSRNFARVEEFVFLEDLEVVLPGGFRIVEVCTADFTMMLCRVMFCHVIGAVEGAFSPEDIELFLADAVANPIKAHVHCFGSFLFDGVVGNAGRCGVVRDQGRGWLRVSEFDKAGADGARFFCIVEHASEFPLSGGGDDLLEDLAGDVDRAIEARWVTAGFVLFAEEVESGPARAGFRLGQVGAIGFNRQEHVAGPISNGGVGMACGIIHELREGLDSVLGGCALLRGEGA
jgi:hypothetical protein